MFSLHIFDKPPIFPYQKSHTRLRYNKSHMRFLFRRRVLRSCPSSLRITPFSNQSQNMVNSCLNVIRSPSDFHFLIGTEALISHRNLGVTYILNFLDLFTPFSDDKRDHFTRDKDTNTLRR